MPQQQYDFQPGAVLHEAVMGGLRANGTTFSRWCRENGVLQTVARQATFGQSRGENGQAILAKLIEAAGPDFVRTVYERRFLEHADTIRGSR